MVDVQMLLEPLLKGVVLVASLVLFVVLTFYRRKGEKRNLLAAVCAYMVAAGSIINVFMILAHNEYQPTIGSALILCGVAIVAVRTKLGVFGIVRTIYEQQKPDKVDFKKHDQERRAA